MRKTIILSTSYNRFWIKRFKNIVAKILLALLQINKMKQNIQPKKKPMLVPPYQGKKGAFIIRSMKRRVRNLLPQCIVPKVVFTGS